MPKKTKKEKIIAEYHRKLQTAATAGQPAPHSTTQPNKLPAALPNLPTYQLATRPVDRTKEAPTAVLDTSDISAIRYDLTKTLVLAAVTVAIEFLLYWRLGQ